MTRNEPKTASIRVMAVAPITSEAAVGIDAEALYRDHYDAVLRYVRARVASREIAEDLVADVFCRAMTAAPTYRAMRDTPLPWLYRIAAHRVADHYRRQRPACGLDAAAEVVSSDPGPDELVLRQVAIFEVWEVSQDLPKTQRRALWLRYGRQLELSEIALVMGKSVEAVKLLIHRAIKHLRRVLAQELPSCDQGAAPGLAPSAMASSQKRSSSYAAVAAGAEIQL
jgi:RNA polymerase sigma factor (sigma-70 family)